MTTLPRFLAASALALVGVLAPLTASAKTCATDAECNPNQKCEEVGSVSVGSCPPCAPDMECPACEPVPEQGETTFECVDQPIACSTDDDCPSYLACGVDSVGVDCPPCAADGGNECPPCEPAPTTGQKVCGYMPRSCENDAQCGEGFACEASATETCTGGAPTCAPNEDCPAPADPICTKDESKSCQVKIIDCSVNTDCPTDWSCEEVSEGGCGSSGTGSVSTPPSSGGGTDPAPPAPSPNPAPAPAPTPQGDDDPGCTTVTRNICIPKGLGFGGTRDASGALGGSNDGKETATPEAPGGAKNGSGTGSSAEAANGTGSDDGCSVGGSLGANAPARAPAPWAVLSLAAAALVGLGRRRRA
jgi:hypothetical protein